MGGMINSYKVTKQLLRSLNFTQIQHFPILTAYGIIYSVF